MPQSAELVNFVCGELRRAADPSRAPAMAAYMKTSQPFYGVAAPQVHVIAKVACQRFLPANPTQYRRNVLALWRQPHREARYAAIEYAAQREFQTPESMPLYERMIREGAWWDLVDNIASTLVGLAYLDHRAAIRPMLDRWIEDPDLWIRRAAILAQLRHKRETDSAQLFRYCLKCSAEREFFIRKAIGWALRAYSYSEPTKVKAFLLKNRHTLSPFSLREGAKQLIRVGRLPSDFGPKATPHSSRGRQ